MSSWLRNKAQKIEGFLDSHTKSSANGAAPAVKPAQNGDIRISTPQNQTLLQTFEWHTPGGHWTRLTRTVPLLSDLGITSLWLPPGCKANEPHGNGYDCYDLWDLGEFDQKYTRATKWGSREELDGLIAKAKSMGVLIIWDAVLNHKTAGDAKEECWAVEVDNKDGIQAHRNLADHRVETSALKKIEPWIHYYFPGRGDHYSSMKWHSQHFSGTDWDQRTQKNAVYKILDPPETAPRPGSAVDPKWRKKDWAIDVDDGGMGNGDYLMFSDIDYTNPEVKEDVQRWGQWMVSDVGVDGFRLDAVPHFSWNFTRDWIHNAKKAAERQNRDLFVMGEFYSGTVSKILQWMDRVDNGVYAYDIPLLTNFAKISMAKSKLDVDLRKVFKGTLIHHRPNNAVTLITSHDTQPGQTVETPVAPYFKPLAYAIMLLRREGLPCVFWGDVYGIKGPHPSPAACGGKLPTLILSRKLFAYGEQTDYLESRTSIGWVRHGTWDRADGCVVIMSIGGAAKNSMFVGPAKAGQNWTDVLGNSEHVVTIDEKGYGVFRCVDKSVSVYVHKDANGRKEFGTCHPGHFVME
ncbi:glucan 1,4-alpha-maltohexaosidase precursor [Aureobasidium subglaciale]|nr:glucan 1,4-alpha-maltohexaosidase precursor [Aureobasidium subglaciale]